MRAFLTWLRTVCPEFRVRGNSVEVVHTPDDFYNTLKNLCSTAKRRIVLSSLYFGTGSHEANLVLAIKQSLQQNPGLTCTVLLDRSRGTRGAANSVTMLRGLAEEFPQRFKLHLFHTPFLRGMLWWLLPSRWNEVVGLQHMKIYAFDDAVLVSGANLSDLYFTQRQDRYLLIRDAPQLADYCSGLVSLVAKHSFLYEPGTESNCQPELKPNAGTTGSKPIVPDQVFDDSITTAGYLKPPTGCEHPVEGDLAAYSRQVRESVAAFNERWLKPGADDDPHVVRDDESSRDLDTSVWPIVQMGPFGIDTEIQVLNYFFSRLLPSTSLDMATGYFNVTDSIESNIIGCRSNVNLLMASPSANGFHNGAGLSGYVPCLYTKLAHDFFSLIDSNDDKDSKNRIKLLEYVRPGWSFHGKGLWYNPGSDQPYWSLAGSTNFGERSANRDIEMQLMIATTNSSLRQRFAEECSRLKSFCEPLTAATFKDAEHYVPFWVRIVSRFVKSYF